MGHNLDITNGVASYADSAARADGRTDAWHALGQTINREMAPAEALELAHMSGWDVRKIAHEQTVVGEDGVDVVRAKGLHTVLRTNPHTRRPEALGVVGDQW